jgi:leader peptidase (prepilin peptidase)/N-methyltransferase
VSPSLLIVHASTAMLAIAAAIVDWRTSRLPHVLTLPAAAIAITGQGYFGSDMMEAVAGAICGFSILKGAQLYYRRRTGREGIGSGDAFLMLSLGALLGLELLYWGILASSIVCLVSAKIFQKKRMPLGPGLAAGCLGVLVFSKVLV